MINKCSYSDSDFSLGLVKLIAHEEKVQQNMEKELLQLQMSTNAHKMRSSQLIASATK